MNWKYIKYVLWKNIFNERGDITTGLVGWWKFDENSSGTMSGLVILDSSGNNNTGTAYNNPSWTTGIIGKGAINLTATNQYVDFGNNGLLNGATAATWAFWINQSTLTSNRIMTTWGDTLGSWLISLTGSGAEIQFALRTPSGDNYLISHNTTTSMLQNTNYCVVITWTAPQTINMYINNNSESVNITSSNNVTSIANSTYNQQLGYETSEGQNGMKGVIDEFRIYNRALSSSDATQYYNYTGSSFLSNLTLLGVG